MSDEVYEELINQYLDEYLNGKYTLEGLAVKLKKENELENAVRTIRYKLSEAIHRITGKRPAELKFLDDVTKSEESDEKEVNEGRREYKYSGERSITSKAEAVEFFKIDLDKEEVYKSVFNSWDVTSKNKEGETEKRTNYQVKLFVQPKKVNIEEFGKELIESFKKYSPKYLEIKRTKQKEGHLLVIDIADLHINKYADAFLTNKEYNSSIAVKRALKGTEGLLQKSSGYNIDKILFVIGNDILNTDNSSKTTTKGTLQDTDTNWFTAFNIAKDCYIKCLEMCLSIADVDVIHCPSNHDYHTGCFLAETLSAWFRNCKNINFDTFPKYRKYYKYHSNMIELEHGDKGKSNNLPLIMAQENPKMWAETKFRYGYLHHIHHSDITKFQSGKDYIGVNVTYLRSPSSADLWHYENQYINMIAVEGFIHSKDMGRVSHLTHYF